MVQVWDSSNKRGKADMVGWIPLRVNYNNPLVCTWSIGTRGRGSHLPWEWDWGISGLWWPFWQMAAKYWGERPHCPYGVGACAPCAIRPLSVLQVCLSCPVLSVCLWRCIVAKQLDGSRWNLACRYASALVKFSIFLLIFEWALQQCSATALSVMGTQLPLPYRDTSPIFGWYLLWPNGWMD